MFAVYFLLFLILVAATIGVIVLARVVYMWWIDTTIRIAERKTGKRRTVFE